MKLRTAIKVKLGISILCTLGCGVGLATDPFPWSLFSGMCGVIAAMSAWKYFDDLIEKKVK